MASYLLDWSHWPVVLMTPPSRPMTDDELRQCMDDVYEGLKTRTGPYVLVQDLRSTPATSARQRQMQAAEMKRVSALPNVTQLGAAFVFSSALLRGTMTAIFWLYRPTWETRVFGELQEAISWANDLLAKRG